jgi:hypothetical protein
MTPSVVCEKTGRNAGVIQQGGKPCVKRIQEDLTMHRKRTDMPKKLISACLETNQ